MTDELAESLERVIDYFDLGEYEVEAYLAVLGQGSMTASSISDRTEIPQPRVYDTVRSLEDHGLVEIRESRPMRVVAVDPLEAFADVADSIDRLIDSLAERYTEPARGTEAVTLVKSRSSILRYLGETIDLAEYELELSLSPSLLERYADRLADAVERGVTVDLLLSPRSDVPEEFDFEDVATQVRGRRGQTTPLIAVADGRYSVYTTRDALTNGGNDRYGVIFNRSALGFLIFGFFATVLWTTARPVADHDGGPHYPRLYASVRRCVRDLRRSTGSFVARVEGRDVITGEERVVEGDVVDTTIDSDGQVASITVDAAEGLVEVGGRVAAYEDVEALEIEIQRVEES